MSASQAAIKELVNANNDNPVFAKPAEGPLAIETQEVMRQLVKSRAGLFGDLYGIAIAKSRSNFLETVKELREHSKNVSQPHHDIKSVIEEYVDKDITFKEGEERIALERTLSRKIANLSNEDLADAVQTFGTFPFLVNIAEKMLKVEHDGHPVEGFDIQAPHALNADATIRSAKEDEGITVEQMEEMLQKVGYIPTLTSHPNEARHPDIKRIQRYIEKELEEFEKSVGGDETDKTFAILEQREIIQAYVKDLAEGKTPEKITDKHINNILWKIEQLWNVRGTRIEAPSVSDEVQATRNYLTKSILWSSPGNVIAFEDALKKYYPEKQDWDASNLIRYRMWAGGDRDGNPKVTGKVTVQTVKGNAKELLDVYYENLKELSIEVPFSRATINTHGTPENINKLDARRLEILEETEQTITKEIEDQPFQAYIQAVLYKLEESQNALLNDKPYSESYGYHSPEELEADLTLLEESLFENKHDRDAETVKEICYQLKIFGFHLASLDVRQSSKKHENCLDKIFGESGVQENYSDLPEHEKVALLESCIKGQHEIHIENFHFDESQTQTIEAFNAIRECHQKYGENTIQQFVISHAERESDVLETMLLAKLTGLIVFNEDGDALNTPIEISPLFESGESLKSSPDELRKLCGEGSIYRRYIEQLGDSQEIMIGYSDSTKDVGAFDGLQQTRAAERALTDVGKELGLDLGFFHGNGPNDGRGNGKPQHEAILSRPRGTIRGTYRCTIQGEHAEDTYNSGNVTKAQEKRALCAMLSRRCTDENSSHPLTKSDEYLEETTRAGEAARNVYRDLVDDPDFYETILSTLVASDHKFIVGSRPAKRPKTDALARGEIKPRDAARAIGWNNDLTTIGFPPGFFSMGTGINELSPNFRNEFFKEPGNQRQVRRTELAVIRCAASLQTLKTTIYEWGDSGLLDKEKALNVFDKIGTEYDKALDAVRTIQSELNEEGIPEAIRLRRGEILLKHSAATREPYTRVLRLCYFEALKRYRAEKEENGKASHEMSRLVGLSRAGLAASNYSAG